MVFGEEKRMKKQRLEAEQDVLPSGCLGRVGVKTEIVNFDGANYETKGMYRVTPNLGCVGLVNGVVVLNSTDVKTLAEPNRTLQFLTETQVIGSQAAGFYDACATCPSGLLGKDREVAREALTGLNGIDSQLELAREQKAAAEAQARATEVQIELLRLQQGQQALPPAQSQLPPAQS